MRVFITGASGFIGKHITEAANSSGHEIIASRLNRSKDIKKSNNINWIYGDLSNIELVGDDIKSFNPEVVIHLAWQGIPDYSMKISKINLDNSISLFEFIFKNTDCNKIVVAGSCWEYGKNQGVCKESDSITLKSYFAWAKHSLNQYLSYECKKNNIIFNWFRIFYVYGPGQRAGSLVPMLIESISKSQRPSINNPMNRNDFIYVKDVSKAFENAINLDIPSGIYNLGSGQATSVYDLCKIVEKKILDSKTISKKINKKEIRTVDMNFWANMEKTKQALDLTFDFSINDGIGNQIASMNINTIK